MIAIIKYNAGNSRSVQNALNRLGAECIVTREAEIIKNADKVIFPGVGEARSAMHYLKRDGMDVVIKNLTQPVLGICLGLQLLCKHSEEGNTTCLGVFNSEVRLFPPVELVPHMGWNNLSKTGGKLLSGVSKNDDLFFVHSYYAEIGEDTCSECDYILPFSATMEKNNFFATQFHPEKSAAVGERILKNFLSL